MNEAKKARDRSLASIKYYTNLSDPLKVLYDADVTAVNKFKGDITAFDDKIDGIKKEWDTAVEACKKTKYIAA